MTPNKIIAALLDITSAAYNVAHNGRKDTLDGRPVVEVDPSQHDTLMNALAVLDPLMAEVVATQANPPACARELLESFLVGEHIVGEIAMTRTRPFGVEGVDHVTVNVGTADVQRDGIEFHAQPWQAPASGPGFTASAEFPTSGPISHDFYTHRENWRGMLEQAVALAPTADDESFLKHELRAFDRAFASLPPTSERRAKPRLDLPTIPVVGKDALIEATRPLFEKAMKADKHRAELDERGLYKGMTEHRFEGWRAAVQTMGFKPGSDDIGALREQAEAWQAVSAALHQHVPEWSKLSTRAMDSAVMTIGDLVKKRGATILHDWLADTADEAHKIINDAGLLANLHDLFKMEPCAEVSIRELKTGGWTIYVDPFDQDTKPRSYRSTSMHQAIVVAHKGERDLLQPEHEECQFCGFTVETPCEVPPADACPTAVAAQVKDMDDGIAQANEMQDNMRQYGTIDKPALLTQVGWRHVMHQEHGQERTALTESKECPWGERGVNFSPEYAVTVAPVYEKAGERPEPEGDASSAVPANPNGTDIRRNQMTKLLMDVKDTISVTVAKRVVSEVGKVTRMSDIPADKIEDVIRACEMELELKGMPTPPPAAPPVPPAPVEWGDANHDLSKAPK